MNNIAILIHDKIEHPKDYEPVSINRLVELTELYDNIYIGDLLDYIITTDAVDLLKKIAEKLTDNGYVHIKGPDLLQMCWYVTRMNLDMAKIRYILYQTGRLSCYNMDEIILILNQIPNITITNACYVNGYEYSLTIQKI